MKVHYLKFDVRKTIKMTFVFMNEREKTIASLIVMLYDLNEKKFETNEKSMIKSFAKKHFENNSIERKINKRIFYRYFHCSIKYHDANRCCLF